MRAMLAAVCVMVIAAMSHAAEKPNVVFIVSDDQGWNDYSFMNHPHLKTPHLDKLAAESVCYTRGYVPTSVCRPSLASMMTGRYPHEHKITGNDPAPIGKGKDRKDAAYLEAVKRYDSFIDKWPTIPRVLGELGYVSFQTGKWWEGNYSAGGFTAGMTGGDPSKGGRHGDAGLKIGRETMQPMYDFMDQAVAEKKPFFVWYAPMMPHDPHTPPARFADKFRKMGLHENLCNYYGMVEWFDETCGDLLGWLDKKGLGDNTIILYICDNGWIQSTTSKGFAPGSKLAPNEGGTRTPIMVRWRAGAKPRMDTQHLAESIDFLPTLIAACGVKSTESLAKLPGVNLLDEQAVAARKTIYGEIYTHDVNDLDKPAASLRYRWIIDGQDKLIMPFNSGQSSWFTGTRPQLFNVVTDPWEKSDRYVDEQGRVNELIAKLDAWWTPGSGNGAGAGKKAGKKGTKQE
jgi:uncharacterized sulfatase